MKMCTGAEHLFGGPAWNQIRCMGTRRGCNGPTQSPIKTIHDSHLMDFTLAQLSNENLTLLFNQAFYQAEELTSTNEDGEEETVATMVYLNDWNYIVYADAGQHCLAFETRITGIEMEMDLMLKICNFFDRFPVHANAFTDQEGTSGVSFLYKHFVPEGTSISDRSLIGVFRIFAQMFEKHYANWHHVREHVV